MQLTQRPISPIPAIAQSGGDQTAFSTGGFGEALYRSEIPFQIPARYPEPRCERSVSSDASVEPERRRDLGPVCANPLAQFGKGIAHGDRSHETAVDGNFGKLRAFIAHGKDRAVECG